MHYDQKNLPQYRNITQYNANLTRSKLIYLALIYVALSANLISHVKMKLNYVNICKNETNKLSCEEKWVLNIYNVFLWVDA